MSAQWATAIVAAAGLAGNLLWTLINLRIENRVLKHIDAVKDWALDTFEPRRERPVLRPTRVNGTVAG